MGNIMNFKINYLSLTFIIFLTACGASMAQTPANGATGVSVTPNFSFTGTSLDTERIQVATTSGFTHLVIDKKLGSIGTTVYIFSVSDLIDSLAGHSSLSNYRKYYWRLTDDSAGDNVYDGPYSFTTILGPPTAVAASSLGLTSFTANWTANANGGAVSYVLRVGTSPGSANIDSVNVGNVFSYAVSGLSPNTYYYYTVQAYDGTYLSSVSDTVTVTTLPSPPVATTATLITPSSFSANWNSVVGASSYVLSIGTSPGGTQIVNNLNVGNVTTYSKSGLTANTNYYYSVEVIVDSNTSSASDTIEVATLIGPPTAVAATVITNSSFSANWIANATGGATAYLLRVGTTSGGTQILHDVNVGNVLTYSVSGLSPSTVYYYSVKALNGTDTSSSSNQVSDTTLPSPVLTAPVNTLTGVSIEPLFSWTWSGVGSSTFDLIIRDSTAHSPADTITGLSTSGSYSHQLLETELTLINNHTYSWQIIANLAVSAINTFTTSLTAAANPSTPVNGTTVYSYTPVNFSWSVGSSVGPITFKVQYLKNSNLIAGHIVPNDSDWAAVTTTTTGATSNLSIDTVNLLAGTEYWWRIISLRGNDIISYSSANGQSFTTSGGTAASAAIPSWPVGTPPPVVYTDSPTLSWYINSGDLTGITFKVVVSTNSNLSNPIIVDSGITNLYYNVTPALAPATTYYWAVTTYGTGTIDSVTSATESFITNGTGTVLLPVLSYPTGGVTLYTQSPTFFWFLNSATSGVTYKVYIDSSLDSSVTDLYSLTTGLTLTPGKHTWYVTATNGNPAQNQSTAPDSFIVAGGIAQGLTVASWPVGNATIYTTTPTLSWYLNGLTLGLRNFVVAWDTTSLGPNGTWQNLSNVEGISGVESVPDTILSYTLSGSQALNYGQTYYWAVASYDGNTYSPWSIDTFTVTGISGSSVPIAFYPIGDEPVYSTSLSLSWYVLGPTAGINHYQVIYSSRADMDTTDHTNTFVVNVTTPLQYLAVTGLVPGSTYYWKVGSSPNGSAPTTYSAITSFVVVPITSQSVVVPLIGSPNNGVGLTLSSAVLSWVIPVKSSGSLTYQLQYSNTPDMSNSTTISSIKSPSQIVSGLLPDKVYYWRVQSVNSKGQISAYSETGQFSTKSVTAVTNNSSALPKEFTVSQNYPNPFNPSTLINYSLPKSSLVTIKIYNILGQEVKTLVNSQLQAGNYTAQWNGDNNFGRTVATGVYIYQVKAGQYAKTMKMMFLK
jgi:hypothetical protein